jgi:hypothetical protein
MGSVQRNRTTVRAADAAGRGRPRTPGGEWDPAWRGVFGSGGSGPVAGRPMDVGHAADRPEPVASIDQAAGRARVGGVGRGDEARIEVGADLRGRGRDRQGNIPGARGARAGRRPAGGNRAFDRGGFGPLERDGWAIVARPALGPGRCAGERQAHHGQQEGQGPNQPRVTAGSSGIHPASKLAKMGKPAEGPRASIREVGPAADDTEQIYTGMPDDTSDEAEAGGLQSPWDQGNGDWLRLYSAGACPHFPVECQPQRSTLQSSWRRRAEARPPWTGGGIPW